MHPTRLAIAVLVLFACATTQAAEPQAIQLFNGKDLTGWTAYAKDADARGAWSVKDGVIHCTGAPNGYLKTDRSFTSYVLRLQWRWPAKPGNSGVLLRTQPPDALWPKCIEAQLMHENAGDLLPLDGFTATRAKKSKPSNEKPAGEWNQYVITLDGPKVELKVNGEVQSSINDAQVVAGTIAFQSEGAPIEFRNIEIVPIGDETKPSGSAVAPARRALPGLDGWHVTGDGDWSYRDGVVEGKQSKNQESYTHLVTDRSYRDFVVSLKFKAIRGNSGLSSAPGRTPTATCTASRPRSTRPSTSAASMRPAAAGGSVSRVPRTSPATSAPATGTP